MTNIQISRRFIMYYFFYKRLLLYGLKNYLLFKASDKLKLNSKKALFGIIISIIVVVSIVLAIFFNPFKSNVQVFTFIPIRKALCRYSEKESLICKARI